MDEIILTQDIFEYPAFMHKLKHKCIQFFFEDFVYLNVCIQERMNTKMYFIHDYQDRSS